MKASVIVTCYNHQKTVTHALDSVLKNLIEDTELIICDDASQDESSKVVDRWININQNAFERVIFIKHYKNQGVTQSLNELISECRGELISPLASDDYYLDGAIRARRNTLVSNPEWLGAFSDGIAVGLNDEVYSTSIMYSSNITPQSLNPSNIKQTILHQWVEPMNLQFWRNNAFKSHCGEFEFDDSVYCEDLNFALSALSKNAFGYLDHKCVAYRCRTWPQSYNIQDLSLRRKMYYDMAYCYSKYSSYFPLQVRGYMINKSQYLSAVAIGNTDLEIKHYQKICFGIKSPIIYLILYINNLISRVCGRILADITWWKKNWLIRLFKKCD